ncbi:MAG: hypothetical protein [Pavo cristatus parvo-like hybrid virus]|nr:MAG: hypothetical protein [Pavo cristatus parvo-like hybrid virus]
MARTVASERRKELAEKFNNTSFKSQALYHVMNAYYRTQYESLDAFYQRELQHSEVEKSLLRDRIQQLELEAAQHRHTINLQTNVITIANANNASLREDSIFMDNFVQEVYQDHPEIAWEYRNRLQYDSIPVRDPDDTETEPESVLSDVPEEYAHLFEDSEEEATRQLEERMEEEGFF